MSCISRSINIVDGMATAPLPPPAPGFVAAMGRTNDAIIYGGRVQLFVVGTGQGRAQTLADKLPSLTSKDYGKPFAEIFEAVKGDFYAIDRMLFSPAMVTVTALESGESFEAGRIDDGDPRPLLQPDGDGVRRHPVLRAEEMAWTAGCPGA